MFDTYLNLITFNKIPGWSAEGGQDGQGRGEARQVGGGGYVTLGSGSEHCIYEWAGMFISRLYLNNIMEL